MSTMRDCSIVVVVVAVLSGCDLAAIGVNPTPAPAVAPTAGIAVVSLAATDAPVQVAQPTSDAAAPAATPELAQNAEPAATPTPADALNPTEPEAATPSQPEAATSQVELATLVSVDTGTIPSQTPDTGAIATLVASQFGTFPEFTDANGNTVAWNEIVQTASMPNAGFFASGLPDGVELVSLDCKVIFDNQVVFERNAPADDLTLFGPDVGISLIFADANFLWPDYDNDGTQAPIVSGQYTIVVRGETTAGPTDEQVFPFVIDLDAVPTDTPADGSSPTPTLVS